MVRYDNLVFVLQDASNGYPVWSAKQFNDQLALAMAHAQQSDGGQGAAAMQRVLQLSDAADGRALPVSLNIDGNAVSTQNLVLLCYVSDSFILGLVGFGAPHAPRCTSAKADVCANTQPHIQQDAFSAAAVRAFFDAVNGCFLPHQAPSIMAEIPHVANYYGAVSILHCFPHLIDVGRSAFQNRGAAAVQQFADIVKALFAQPLFHQSSGDAHHMTTALVAMRRFLRSFGASREQTLIVIQAAVRGAMQCALLAHADLKSVVMRLCDVELPEPHNPCGAVLTQFAALLLLAMLVQVRLAQKQRDLLCGDTMIHCVPLLGVVANRMSFLLHYTSSLTLVSILILSTQSWCRWIVRMIRTLSKAAWRRLARMSMCGPPHECAWVFSSRFSVALHMPWLRSSVSSLRSSTSLVSYVARTAR